jgi:phenylalanyl-tRNA synthetase beta chain
MLEINFSKLKDFLKDKSDSRKEFKKLSFQSSIRDFSFSIDKTISSGEVVNFIKSLDKELIRTVKVFDDYSDDSQNRAIAIEVKIQSEVKTLSESEINKVSEEIVKKTEEKFSAKLR